MGPPWAVWLVRSWVARQREPRDRSWWSPRSRAPPEPQRRPITIRAVVEQPRLQIALINPSASDIRNWPLSGAALFVLAVFLLAAHFLRSRPNGSEGYLELARGRQGGRVRLHSHRCRSADEMMRISHEAIYQALFVQGRGALRRELTTCLRTGRALGNAAGARGPAR